MAEPFTLPALPYAHNALLPIIDEMTMQIHHGKHHAGYVTNLNKALETSPLKGKSITEIMMSLTGNATENAVRNNAGGHFNHTLFWEIMTPGGAKMPEGKLGEAIKKKFTSFEGFKTAFSDAAMKVFGSGWAWLAVDKNGEVFISSTPNQDNPLMSKIVAQGGTPILGIDVWEHAYYLKYQNLRKDYVTGFLSLINWDVVGKKYAAI
ncbi:MAG TPA: superoxide dismutase [Saprospiraceae bacterium]|nr:superoxide dismutase [Saprospiraceae bacterium]